MTNQLIVDNETLSRIPIHSRRAATRIIEFISTHPNSTISDIAKGTNLSESAIRYTLIDLLALRVIAESQVSKDEPRSRGRPAQRYCLQKALIITTPPRRYWQLADMLISTFLRKFGREATTELFQDMGKQAANDTAQVWRRSHRVPMSIVTFRKKLGESLNQLGYNASVQLRDKTLVIRTYNCLFQEVSFKYEGLMCHFHNSYYPTLFTIMCKQPVRNIERVSCRSHGDEGCQLEIRL
ncbi:MAG: helix-turn-helix transcriptional regulator [Promethearchaeota archaeon]